MLRNEKVCDFYVTFSFVRILKFRNVAEEIRQGMCVEFWNRLHENGQV
jgi:hypothetical protein